MGKPKRLKKLIKSAKMGNSYAMYRLGICFETGYLTGQDSEKAAMWICKAGELGYAPAVDWINDYFFDDSPLVQAES